MPRYVPPSIKSSGGITRYLNKTKSEHNGYNATDLKKNWNWGTGNHMTLSNLAIMFGVTRQTVDKWVTLLHDEAGIPRPKL